MSVFDVDVAIVGAGPAGTATALRLAAAGHDVAVFERLAQPIWRASGVYSSPLTRRRLAALGLTTSQLDALIQPIPQMVIETSDGDASCRLDYSPPSTACGVDRVRLEQQLVALIRSTGARVYEGAVVRSVSLGRTRSRLTVSQASGVSEWSARVVVGADGPTSVVARGAGVTRETRLFRRAALTGHRTGTALAARMVVGRGWYMGIAPVPAERLNLGLVMSESELRRQLLAGRPADVVDTAVRKVPKATALVAAPSTDAVVVHLPLVHRVRRVAGDGFVLVGDAAGFIDPLSGEGLHRALVSAERGAGAIHGHFAGSTTALQEYDRHLRARFGSKDVLSWALQLFMLEPLLARRAIRNLDRRSELRETFAAALADLAPASAVFDPRFVVRLLS